MTKEDNFIARLRKSSFEEVKLAYRKVEAYGPGVKDVIVDDDSYSFTKPEADVIISQGWTLQEFTEAYLRDLRERNPGAW